MAAWFNSWIFLWVVSFCTSVRAGLYFPKRNYTFYITHPLRADDVIGVIHASRNGVIRCENSSVELTTSEWSSDIYAELEETMIFINVLSDSLSFTDNSVFELTISCENETSSLHPYYQQLMVTKVLMRTDNSMSSNDTSTLVPDTSLTTTSAIQDWYPANQDLVYYVIENTEPGVLDSFNLHRMSASADLIISSIADEFLFLNATTGELVLLKAIDRERKERLTLQVSCRITTDDQSDVAVTRSLTVNVLDVNDNPPYTEYKKVVQVANYTADNMKLTLKTYDYDGENMTTPNSYRIYTNDTTGAVVVNGSTFVKIARSSYSSGTLIRTDVAIVPQNSTTPYTVDVTVEDLTYQHVDGDINQNNKAIHRIIIPALLDQSSVPYELKKYSFKASTDNAAAKYSLLENLSLQDGLAITNTTIYEITGIIPIYLTNMVAVTATGTVYVNDTTKLSRYNETKPITVIVVRSDDGSRTGQYLLAVTVDNNLRSAGLGSCETGCSIHNTQENCTASCGYGASTGLCKWRKGEISMSVNYSTCSPDLDTCPDGFCSDLENMHFLNCPQDCSKDPVHGQRIRPPSEQGIYKAKRPCWCESKPTDGKTYCTCEPPRMPKYNSTNPAGHISNPGGKENEVISTQDGNDNETCSSSCKAAITGSLSAVVVVTVCVLMGWMIFRRRRRRHAIALKHVSSLVSMTAVPSDYVVDDTRDLRGHANRQTSSPASYHWPMKLGFGQDVFEDKWEFPRRYLTLEHVIGEGEFGQVVRAQAFMLRGQEGNTVVAVKMLKPDASGAEYQDLVSELQLLKEVSHPNVVQLLGVCTQKGPLYVIVEYCELGSLRNFLRASKFKNKVSWDEKMKTGNNTQTVADNNIEVRVLTCRDFFSFAWQIAKGMDYLASLKIVHRDLAARNVLVTDGLKMKISDFGLSRDVYEADTYLKMSKGRIPVKWMAPESLYGQIYSTKSDIWSYGIVLWEIITLGASPYPGIPPERLFPLLSTGYRMDRPDECPDELYAIMQKCWKLEPENRPPFSMLRDILDNLLQQNTEYLDLSGDNYLLHGTSSDNRDKQVDVCLSTQASTKPQYSNICSVNHCPPNVYVTTHWEGDDLDNDECPEMSKLLGNKEIVETKIEAGILIDTDVMDGRKITDQILVHENLTYV